MRNHLFIKGFKAGAAITKHRIVKHSSDDVTAIQGAAATDSIFGVAELGATQAGDHVSVVMGGVAVVEYGGNVTRGALLTTDSVGRAVAAAPAAGSNARTIGVAMVSGVSGDLGSVMIAPGSVQG